VLGWGALQAGAAAVTAEFAAGSAESPLMKTKFGCQGTAFVSLSTSAASGPKLMLVVHVHVHVKPECVEAFRLATLANARQSVQEPGIARFDVVQQADDPTRFVLVEAYRTPQAPATHKETAHYAQWRDAVASMMAEPRSSVKYANVFPDDQGW
jgi:(4S)-4-hydroxy-5-phosphonooxypentane-2,3-dione isomerase